MNDIHTPDELAIHERLTRAASGLHSPTSTQTDLALRNLLRLPADDSPIAEGRRDAPVLDTSAIDAPAASDLRSDPLPGSRAQQHDGINVDPHRNRDRRADPAQIGDAAPAIDATGYLDALRTRSSNAGYIDTELTPTERSPNRHRWLSASAAAATVAVIVGGLALAARDDNETGGAAGQVAPTDTTVSRRVGFIGLPPEGATPSAPPWPPVVAISPCYAPIGDPSEIDTLPPLGTLWVFADERLIWQKFEDLPEGANSRSTGLLEQRLTPDGVELMSAEATAAVSSGEIRDEDCVADRGYFVALSPDGGQQDFRFVSADNEHLARIIDPWSAARIRLGGPRGQGLRAV